MSEPLLKDLEASEDFVSSLDESIVEYFTLTLSTFLVVKRLGYEDLAQDIAPLVKLGVGELVVRLSTNRYVRGLASELGKHAKKLWEVDYSDSEIVDILNEAMSLRRKVDLGIASKEEAHELLLRFLNLIGLNPQETEVVINILKDPEPPLVLQLIATALAVCVGGLGGS
ncbi:MAG: hypothetical protein QN229_05810 [Desulfurococcaceae archaeon TW002]